MTESTVTAGKALSRRVFVGASVAAAAALGLGIGAGRTNQAQADEGMTMTVAWTSNRGDYSLDPTNNYMGWQGSYLGIYEQLYRIDGNFEAQPMLAESVTTDDGGLTWTLNIREGVTFQNGKALDAAAVQASLERAIANNTRCDNALGVQSMSADGQVLTVTLKQPSPFFVNELCEPVTSVIDVESGTEDDMPVGTGPFAMASVDASGNVELDAYEGYWQGAPKVSHVTALYLTDDTSKVNALQSGEVQALMNVGDDQLALFQDNPDFTVHQTNQARSHMLYFNMNSPVTADERVRRALCKCVNRDAYVDALYYGAAEVAPGVFPQESGWSEGIEQEGYDPEGARTLLEEAGYTDEDGDGFLEKDGQPLSITLVTYEANAALPKVCEVLASELAEVGVKATVEVAEQIATRLESDGWEVGTMAYSTLPTGSPITYLSAVMSSEGSANYGKFASDEVDDLLSQLRQATDTDEQHQIVKQIQEIALGDCSYFYMVHALVNDVAASNVENLAMQGQYDWLNNEMELAE